MNDLKSTPPQSERSSFCEHLRRRREARDLSLEDISRTTKIPERSLAYLEQGEFEKLPADVFVRGFLRSYATCVGLDAEETVRRYAACGLTPGPVASPNARALLDPKACARSGGERSRPVEPEPEESARLEASEQRAAAAVLDATSHRAAAGEPSRRERGKRRRRKRKGRARAAAGDRTAEPNLEPTHATTALPKEPPAPVLVIDDADPEAAATAQAERAKGDDRERDFSRRMFLPPVLLDPDQGSRRGALTLAVIILVIVATITMSYLLRRPSASADGVTELGPAHGITASSESELLDA